MSTEGTLPPAEGGAAPAPPANNPPAPDNQAYWTKAKEAGLAAGKAAAEADYSAKMKELFGTTDPNELSQMATKLRGKNETQVPDTVMQELTRLKSENESLKKQGESKSMRDKVMSDIMSASQRVHDVNDTIDMLMLRYDFKMMDNKLVVHHKDSGDPVFLEGSNLATISNLFESWSKDPKQAWRLATQSQIAAPSGKSNPTGPDAGNYNYQVKPEDWSLPGFAEAVEKSGQKDMAISGKMIDYERLKPFLQRYHK